VPIAMVGPGEHDGAVQQVVTEGRRGPDLRQSVGRLAK
jgi:hypothetical protein